jgi:hypothetical protein
MEGGSRGRTAREVWHQPSPHPNKIWRQLYLQNFEPREAAHRIEVIYVNAPPD